MDVVEPPQISLWKATEMLFRAFGCEWSLDKNFRTAWIVVLRRVALPGSDWERRMFSKPQEMGWHNPKREVHPFTWFCWCHRWNIEGLVGWFSRSGQRSQISLMSEQILILYITKPPRNSTWSVFIGHDFRLSSASLLKNLVWSSIKSILKERKADEDGLDTWFLPGSFVYPV